MVELPDRATAGVVNKIQAVRVTFYGLRKIVNGDMQMKLNINVEIIRIK